MEIVLSDSGIWRICACGIRNPGLWNPESLKIRIHNSSYTDKDSGIQYLESGIHKRGILNRRSYMGRAKKEFDFSDGG